MSANEFAVFGLETSPPIESAWKPNPETAFAISINRRSRQASIVRFGWFHRPAIDGPKGVSAAEFSVF
jgi:hypothetical protein